jgi:uncharacterized membrane protein YdbT with pleckstrin-like domain
MNDPYLITLLGANERVLLVTRQHWFVLVEKTLAEGVLAVLIAVLVTLVWVLLLPVPVVALGYLLMILPLLALAADFANWWSRKYVVTTRRVIQVSGVLSKNVTDSSLEKVNDVKMEQSALGRLFGYGDIEILTASELGVNLFRRIGDPIRFKTAMLNAKEQMEPRGGPPAADLPDNSVPGLLAQLDSLRRQGVLTEEEFQRKKAELLAKL